MVIVGGGSMEAGWQWEADFDKTGKRAYAWEDATPSSKQLKSDGVTRKLRPASSVPPLVTMRQGILARCNMRYKILRNREVILSGQVKVLYDTMLEERMISKGGPQQLSAAGNCPHILSSSTTPLTWVENPDFLWRDDSLGSMALVCQHLLERYAQTQADAARLYSDKLDARFGSGRSK